MSVEPLSADFTAAGQVTVDDMPRLVKEGYTAILCLRPDDEEPEQPKAAEIAAAAEAAGLQFGLLPMRSSERPHEDMLRRLQNIINDLKGDDAKARIYAYCRSGGRVRIAYDLLRALPGRKHVAAHKFDVVIVGGGSGGIATAASLIKRRPELTIAVIEPAAAHYYQPAWTLVGGGAYSKHATKRTEASVMPKDVNWVHHAVTAFRPENDTILLEDETEISYKALVVATGLRLNFDAIPGLEETLGKNGVTSNYRYDLAPYTWELVQGLKAGKAIFTQPPAPFKCAGAPQKAVYLSCDAWAKRRVNDAISVEFDVAGPALFGVKDFVPVLMSYIQRYKVDLQLNSKLVHVDGDAKTATFERQVAGKTEIVTQQFDMLHVVPPQSAPKVVRESALANAEGYLAVDPQTLQHITFKNVFGVGDVIGTSNAKTAAAARKQAPIIAENLLATMDSRDLPYIYDGYGGCPLTVENGKVVLAEFGYGGKLMPSFPKWIINGFKPSRVAWTLKKYGLPFIYWNAMLKGREIMLGLKRR
ncbi:Pyr-redox-2 domain-containing protein [Acetobacteraceae bacterium EV16G]|uniref:Pyr-redox-2 domain-containing protein n=1 Tax=Sorlinia euscelidii TaxID=3081148 RepID=A0ABU7U4B9_9PROT